MRIFKRTVLIAVIALLTAPLVGAQEERSDSAYVFHFKAGDDMFYVPYSGNGDELARLEECVASLRECILAGEIKVHVNGYSNLPARMLGAQTDADSRRLNLEVAKIRSNRVKSELILRQGLTENCFVTANHSSCGDCVTVTIPKSPRAKSPCDRAKASDEAAAQAEAEKKAAEEAAAQAAAEKAAAERAAAEAAAAEQAAAEAAAAQAAAEAAVAQAQTPAEQSADAAAASAEKAKVAAASAAESAAAAQAAAETLAEQAAKEEGKVYRLVEKDDYTLALRANLLRWATLTPDLGLEWRINQNIGVLAHGTYTSWSWRDMDRRYALGEVTPEVRWYLGREKRSYIGVMGKYGQYNYYLGTLGKQGDMYGGGITGGYQLRIGDCLSLDFNIGIGYLRANYEAYELIDQVRVRDGKGIQKANWIGPTNAGVTLVWKIF